MTQNTVKTIKRTRKDILSAEWAWPTGSLDQLLRAACQADDATAMADFILWLGLNDIDEMQFRDHRLLAAVAQRFGKRLGDCPEYPRLVGLQRQMWTRSRMAIADCTGLLSAMHAAGMTPMLLKGAARIAAHPNNQKARVAHDVDILLPPTQFRDGMTQLLDSDWHASSGASRLRLLAEAENLRAMNFFGGRFGDIDLHQWAYGDAPVHPELEADLIAGAEPAVLMGVQVTIPSPTDRLALAICHSGRDAHAHSDWIVDCAQIISEGRVDWSRLVLILTVANAVTTGRIALGYLRFRLDAPVPDAVLVKLDKSPDGGVLFRLSDTLEAKPRSEWGLVTRIVRGIAKQLRLARQRRNHTALVRPIRGTRMRGTPAVENLVATDVFVANLPDICAGPCQFDIVVSLELPNCPRRVELELNSKTRHLTTLKYQKFSRRGGPVLLRFHGEVNLSEGTESIWISSRPGRFLRPGTKAREQARYGALPLRIASEKITPKPN
jgi:hypothetical protein